MAALACTLAACSPSPLQWQLTDVRHHLPDLSFSMLADSGKTIDAQAFKGHTTLVYFGYTHCPDVCPETMARLMQVMDKLGPLADGIRILFISVDPARDTPQVMHAYVDAFDSKHMVGLTGTPAQIEDLAREYRIAYQAEKVDPSGSYEVTHSPAVYVFDQEGRARLIATGDTTADMFVHDLRQLVQSTS
jgi:protein SCO1/2